MVYRRPRFIEARPSRLLLILLMAMLANALGPTFLGLRGQRLSLKKVLASSMGTELCLLTVPWFSLRLVPSRSGFAVAGNVSYRAVVWGFANTLISDMLSPPFGRASTL